MIDALLSDYKVKKKKIKKRLKDFKKVWEQSDKKIFAELCFCICTPQSKAVYCDRAISSLEKNGNLFKGDFNKVREALKAVRFPNNKTKFILRARELFLRGGTLKIKEKLDPDAIFDTRDWFVLNVKGLGFKEASHFLRNVGFGKNLAILDVHILRNMVRFGVIRDTPKTLTKKQYLSLENKLLEFSDKINIPMDELDLLFWSNETGEIFK